MKRLSVVLVAVSLFAVTGCNRLASAPADAENTADSAVPVAPVLDTADSSADDVAAQAVPVPENVQIYQDPDGMFALALPPDYTYEVLEQGITFVSEDGGFAGDIVYQKDDSASSDVDKMAKQLRTTIEPKFQQIDWQKAGQRQPDGSVRLAWRGEDEADRTIDALSFIEHHDQHTFLLTLYAIDKAYNDYRDDAQSIAGTYVVRRQEAQTTPEDAGEAGEAIATPDAEENDIEETTDATDTADDS